MEAISTFFTIIFYQPLFNGLIFLYNNVYRDFGISIILLTVLIRLILYPLNQKAIKSQKAINDLQPQIKEIQKKTKDKVKQSEELMALYKKNNINPASGCLPLLIQLPILFALYRVFWNGLKPESLNAIYSFISRPDHINPIFLGLIDLSAANYIMAIIAGVLTYIQAKMMSAKQTTEGSDFAALLNKQMIYMMPLFTVFVAWKLPAGLTLYWIVITLVGILQQYLVIRKANNG